MELAKILILLISTIVCINSFRNSPGKGVIVYLVIFAICSLIGFSRGIFGEAIILPLCLLFWRRKDVGYSPIWLVYIIFIVVSTLLRGNKVIGEYDEIMIAGFMLLAARYSLFNNEGNIYKALSALWLFAQCKTLNLVVLTGPSAFSVADANDMASRMLETTTIYGEAGVIDPNYFSLVAGLGFFITIFMIKNPQKFNYHIGKNWFSYKKLLYLFLIFDLFFTIRGLSRGVLLAVMGTFVAYMYFNRMKLSHVILLAVLTIVIYSSAEYLPIIGGFVNRFENDDAGGGRFFIWTAMANVILQDGFLAVLFGEGLNFHWWVHENTVSKGELLSSHNSFVTIFIATGILGGIIMMYLISKAYISAYKIKSPEVVYKVVLLSYIVLGSMSIEPLHFAWAWIVLAFGCSATTKQV